MNEMNCAAASIEKFHFSYSAVKGYVLLAQHPFIHLLNSILYQLK